MSDQIERFMNMSAQPVMVNRDDGGWVRYSDYEKLEAEREEALKRAVDAETAIEYLEIERDQARQEAREIKALKMDDRDAAVLRAEADQARKQVLEEVREEWKQALDFCLGSAGEYGEGTPEYNAYKNVHTFIARLTALHPDQSKG